MNPPILRFDGEYHFLSNFHESPFYAQDSDTLYQVKFDTVEHFFQSLKSTNVQEREWIRTASTPGQAKKRGRQAQQLDPHWETRKIFVMWHGLRSKFEGYLHLRQALLDTGDTLLVEGNTWHDNYWGNCTCGSRPGCKTLGQNWLGRLLMMLRDDLRSRSG